MGLPPPPHPCLEVEAAAAVRGLIECYYPSTGDAALVIDPGLGLPYVVIALVGAVPACVAIEDEYRFTAGK